MKLRVIAKKQNGAKVNLNLLKVHELKLHGKEFEVSDELGKELLEKTFEGNPIVEKVKETKNKETPNNKEE